MTDDAKRCGTCRHWTRNTPTGVWGECLWSHSLILPWWRPLESRGIPMEEREGENENCKAWERKP